MRMGGEPRLRVPADPEQNELVGVVLELSDRDDESEVVEKEELELELIQFVER